jgi:hypothetical protein
MEHFFTQAAYNVTSFDYRAKYNCPSDDFLWHMRGRERALAYAVDEVT